MESRELIRAASYIGGGTLAVGSTLAGAWVLGGLPAFLIAGGGLGLLLLWIGASRGLRGLGADDGTADEIRYTATTIKHDLDGASDFDIPMAARLRRDVSFEDVRDSILK